MSRGKNGLSRRVMSLVLYALAGFQDEEAWPNQIQRMAACMTGSSDVRVFASCSSYAQHSMGMAGSGVCTLV